MSTETPITDRFYRVGEEWRGCPSPRESREFMRKMEKDLMDSKKAEAKMCQTLSIASQTIRDQSGRIDRLEKEKFAAGGGTVDQASTKLLSTPGGNNCQHCGSELERDCVICGAPNCCTSCCRKSTAETLLRRELYSIIEYWQGASECQCSVCNPIGACLKCDMEKLEDRVSELLAVIQSDFK